MLKISKYYKPFMVLILTAIVLLFTQAMCDLKLPDYMSDIVNVGIQSNGIEQVAPEMVSENGYELMKTFMTEQDKAYIEARYHLENGRNVYVLSENLEKEEVEELSHIFAVASRTMLNVFSQVTNMAGSEVISMQNTEELDFSKVYEILAMLNMLPEETIKKAREEALQTPESMLTSIGLVVTESFYREVGMDISNIQIKFIVKTGFKMLGVCVIGIVAAILVGYLGAKIGDGIGRDLRKDVFQKVQSFGTTEFNKFSSASLITRTTNDITQVQNVVVMAIRMLFYAPIMGIGSLIMMSQKTNELTWTIALVCMIIIGLIIFLFVVVLPKIKIVQKLTDKINLVAKENLSGLMVVRAFGTQKYEENRFDKINTEVMKTNRFINRSMGLMMPCMMLAMNGLNLLILWFGAKAIAGASIQVGDLMAVMQYGMHVVMSFLFVSMMFVMLPRASVSANRIMEVLETEISINNPEKPKDFKEDKMGYVEFKNVDFSYPGADEKILEKINFVAKPGQTTAFIGTTGSRKINFNSINSAFV